MCTRTMHTEGKQTITGRNFDWEDWSDAGLWVYPAGLKRNGAAGKYSCEWESKYKSVTASSYNGATDDGMNEKGLVANLLWLADTGYPTMGQYPELKAVCVSAWAQYVLDLCANVSEAIDAMKKIYVVSSDVPDGGSNPVQCHLSVSDSEGNSAIFEYVDGKLVTYAKGNKYYVGDTMQELRNDQLHVMTNEPVFKEQLKLNALWKGANRKSLLPGTCSPIDRFIRATYYTARLPESKTRTEALAHVLSVMHNTAEPFEIAPDAEGHSSPTQYTTLSDQADMRYYFGPAKSPFMVWVDLNEIVFSAQEAADHQALCLVFEQEGALLEGGKPVGGNMTRAELTSAKAFDFIEALK